MHSHRVGGSGAHQSCLGDLPRKNETPLFLFRVKLGNLEKRGKEAFLALR